MEHNLVVAAEATVVKNLALATVENSSTFPVAAKAVNNLAEVVAGSEVTSASTAIVADGN